ncbi:MAG: four helix bundle protein [Gemmatimonadaceae bacterium]|nr:four helix bundle protein [Gemmatimonadaceae bacterium]
MQDHRRLHVYQAARRLVREVYQVACLLGPDERFTLGKQLRRAALSVGSNIAEGCGRLSARDFAHFLDIALGSTRELEFQLLVCLDIGIADAAVSPALRTNHRVQLMLARLITSVRDRARPPRSPHA